MSDTEQQKPDPEENEAGGESKKPEDPAVPTPPPPPPPAHPPVSGPKFNPDLVGSGVDPYAHPEEPEPSEQEAPGGPEPESGTETPNEPARKPFEFSRRPPPEPGPEEDEDSPEGGSREGGRVLYEAEVPGALTYCRVINAINYVIFFLTGLAFAALGAFLLWKLRQHGFAPTVRAGFFALVSAAAFSFLPGFALLNLNKQLKQQLPAARTWQVYWCVLFLPGVPLGTILYGIALGQMLFSEKVKIALSDAEGQKGSPVFGAVAAVLTIVAFLAGAHFLADRVVRGFVQAQAQLTAGVQNEPAQGAAVHDTEPVKPLSMMQLEAKKLGQAIPSMSGPKVELVLTNGNLVTGKLVRRDETSVTIFMEDIGEVPFGTREISEVRELS